MAIAAALFAGVERRHAVVFWIVVGFSALTFGLAAASEPGTWVAGVVGEWIFVGPVVLCSWGIVFLVIFFLNAGGAFDNRGSKSATYELSESGCAVSTENCSWNVSWDSFKRLSYFPGVWLLEFNEPRKWRDIQKSFVASLKASQNIVAAQEQAACGQPIAFPVFWIQPIPIRRYLVLLAKDVSGEHVVFLRRMTQRKK